MAMIDVVTAVDFEVIMVAIVVAAIVYCVTYFFSAK